ncbi:uncharacterized protein TRIADDRAFT_59319 [Trichoplax adhaerens]|uniref:LITAF domain-containing protein n=1 Tax=Trichoplax adhaerens TaxID=10228 RepID=B3S4R6_TRIAD|nr:hypothetical protein TRIADDRAFT_59319 [Trichoplax adhaerens]EDV22134.1 hypothetical protein TRIADDRAFT_59319 [Trichoplax adhaerens]|eukprot:XP_002115289.1 hypothetical protein TRIADDRAFT_59319 [Trichoplax adhaerens]
MDIWRGSGNKNTANHEDQRRQLPSAGDSNAGLQYTPSTGSNPANNVPPNFSSATYSDPSESTHYSNPVGNTALLQPSAFPSQAYDTQYSPAVTNPPTNPPPSYKANDATQQPPAVGTNVPLGQMPIAVSHVMPVVPVISLSYPIIQKITTLNQLEAIHSQSMDCPFCQKSISTGIRYVSGDTTYLMAALCCFFL